MEWKQSTLMLRRGLRHAAVVWRNHPSLRACWCYMTHFTYTFFFNFKSKVNYQDTEAFLSHTFHIIKVF